MPPIELQWKERFDTLEKEFNDFVYTVSHDLGAPLRAVVNFSRMLLEHHDQSFDEEETLYLDFVTEGGRKAQTMLAGLVTYSRLNTLAKPPATVELSALVKRCQDALKDKITACKAIIEIHGPLPEVTGDHDQLFQLLCALMDNALTYQPQNQVPQVHISAVESEQEWKLFIADNGIGIAPDQAERIFKVFKRLHTDAEFPGIGMGLALAKKIVQRHGGSIGIIPSETAGTICWFTLAKSFPQVTSSLKDVAYG